jgi:hypothetical protein
MCVNLTLVQVEYLGLKLLFDVMDVRDDERIDAEALTLYAAEHNDYALVSLSPASTIRYHCGMYSCYSYYSYCVAPIALRLLLYSVRRS